MGFFKKLKNTFSKGLIGGVLGFATGGLAGAAIGGLAGAAAGYGEDRMELAQEKAMEAQLAAAQKIADAQNPANVVSAVTPTTSAEQAQQNEQTAASEASRKYSLSKSLYRKRAKLGNSSSAGAKTTLG